MAIRGETVGAAYVRLLLDGTGLNEAIKKELKENEKEFEAQGKRDSEAYAKALAKGIENLEADPRVRAGQRDFGRSIRASLEAGIARGDLADAYFRSEDWRRFLGVLTQRFGEAGAIAGRSMQQRFQKDANLLGLRGAMGNIRTYLDQANKQIDTAIKDRLKQQEAYLREEDRLRNEAAEARAAETRAVLADFSARVQAQKEYLAEQERAVRQMERGSLRGGRRVIRQLRETRGSLRDAGHFTKALGDQFRSLERRAIAAGGVLFGVKVTFDKFGDTIGNVFGRKSENVALRFFGQIIGGSVKAVGQVFALGGVFEAFGRRMTAAVGDRGASGAVRELGSSFGGLVKTLAPIAGMFTVLVLVLGPLVAIISGLTAAVVALAFSIGGALVAAMVAATATLGVMAAGIGIAVAGYNSLTEAQKKALKADLRPVRREFRALGREARGAFANIEDQAERLAPAIRRLRPVVDATAESLSRVGDTWVDLANSPAMRRFTNTMEVFLPRAVEGLGTSFANFGGGFLNIFEIASRPNGILDRFLGWLEKISDRFLKWTEDAAKQKDGGGVADFFDSIGDSAKAVGGFLDSIWDLLNRLFDPGAKAGDTIISDLERQVRKFTDYLERNPDAISEWFKNGVEIARSIGRVAGAIARIVDTLDNPTNRAIAKGFFRMIVIAAGMTEVAIREIYGGILTFLDFMLLAPSKLPGPWGRAARDIRESVQDAMKKNEEATQGAIDRVKGLDGMKVGLDTSPARGALSDLNQFIALTSGRIDALNNKPRRGPGPWRDDYVPVPEEPSRGPTITPRGIAPTGRMISGNTIVVNTYQADPRAVAMESLNRLVALGY